MDLYLVEKKVPLLELVRVNATYITPNTKRNLVTVYVKGSCMNITFGFWDI